METTYPTFIQRLSQRLWGEKTAMPKESTASSEEIPRYPPFMKGLPAAPVERILDTQRELIQSIEQALALPDALYQAIALPVIKRYAAFSHLLPASESHHHRGAGGLFRHGLEVAHWATLASHGCLFASDTTPKTRKTLEPRWRLAVCFAGLMHDIGKPVSDIAVMDSQGQYTWNPCDENLIDWATQHQIDRYFLRWRENRHKRHQQFSALVIERVLTRESRAYLLGPGPEIMQALLETLHGLDRGSKLYELVVTADCKSVERDLKTHAHSVDAALGMPVERYLFDAMRRLIKSGQWLVNDKGARVWRFQSGVHIVWRTGAQDIVGLLAKDKVPGIPRDEDNPLDKMPFGLCLKVFDATVPAQVELIQHQSCHDKQARVMYLATSLPRQSGWDSLQGLETALQAPVYLLTPDVRSRFQLQQVPAIVEQSGNRLLVRERKLPASTGERS
jgi:conjugal transfer pilus assembly protein TraI